MNRLSSATHVLTAKQVGTGLTCRFLQNPKPQFAPEHLALSGHADPAPSRPHHVCADTCGLLQHLHLQITHAVSAQFLDWMWSPFHRYSASMLIREPLSRIFHRLLHRRPVELVVVGANIGLVHDDIVIADDLHATCTRGQSYGWGRRRLNMTVTSCEINNQMLMVALLR